MKKILLAVAAVLIALVAVGVLAGDGDGRGDDGDVEEQGQVSTEAAAAGCLPVERKAVPAKTFAHVGGEVDYDEAPPVMGDHSTRTVRNLNRFYAREDSPAVEAVVHTLEHGLVVAWYDEELPADEVAKLQQVTEGLTSSRFIAVPWNRSVFEEDRHFVLTAWGVRQRCRSVDDKVVQAFVTEHADKRAPENGAPV